MGMKKSERSRVHAKQRRLLETKEIASITEQLPIPDRVKSKLDKASILRLAITFMRLKQCVGEDRNAKWAIGMLGNGGEARLLLETLGGFFIMVSMNMEVLYVSENVEKHMGIKQVDMISHSFLDYVFAKDHADFLKQFELQPQRAGGTVHGIGLPECGLGSPVEMDISYASCLAGPPYLQYESRRRFFIHMKCIYSQRSAFSPSRANSEYMLLQCMGYLHLTSDMKPNFLAAVCRPLQPTPIMELRMDGNMFLSRHNLDMRFIYCDPRLSTLFGYEPDEVIGQSMYNYHHPSDLVTCSDCHSNLMTTGASMSKYYRFLGKSNEWFWLQTRATVVYNASKYPQYIVCMNYIVSEKEGKRYLEERLKQRSPTDKVRPDSPHQLAATAPVYGHAAGVRDGSGCSVAAAAAASSNVSIGGNCQSETTAGMSSGGTIGDFERYEHSSTFADSGDCVDRDASMVSLVSTISDITLCNMDILEEETGCSKADASHQQPTVPILQPPDEPMPRFFIDTRGEPAAEELATTAVHDKAADSTATLDGTLLNDEPLGNLWLSVHAITDPMASPIHTAEVYPTEFAEELEDMSYAHCSRLMRETTEAALRAYAIDMGSGFASDRDSAGHSSSSSSSSSTGLPPVDAGFGAGSEWEACLAALDRQANRLYDTMHVEGFHPTKRSQSSASLAALSTVTSQSSWDGGGGCSSVLSSVGTNVSTSSARSSAGPYRSRNPTPMSATGDASLPAAPLPEVAVGSSNRSSRVGCTHPSTQSLATSEGFAASPKFSVGMGGSPVLTGPATSPANCYGDSCSSHAGDEHMMEQWEVTQSGSADGVLSPEDVYAIDEMLSEYPELAAVQQQQQPLPLPLIGTAASGLPGMRSQPEGAAVLDTLANLQRSQMRPLSNDVAVAQRMLPEVAGDSTSIAGTSFEGATFARNVLANSQLLTTVPHLLPFGSARGVGSTTDAMHFAEQPRIASSSAQQQQQQPMRSSLLEQLLLGRDTQARRQNGTASASREHAPCATDVEERQLSSSAVGPAVCPDGTEEASLPWNPMSGVQLYNPDDDVAEWISSPMPKTS